MKHFDNPSKQTWPDILARPVMEQKDIESRVAPVLEKVKAEGDAALKHFTAQFDGVALDDLEVSAFELEEAEKSVHEELKQAIRTAKLNIEKFHLVQRELIRKVQPMPGVSCWRKSIPIEKVGLYVPGGTAPLFSTVLMLAIPAGLAGCKEVVLCSPPDVNGKIHPAILYAAKLTGVDRVYKLGGAQAVAAMAYGTETVPQTYKIFGPGNQYVTTAKQLVAKEGIGIDMPAGPSEVAILADHTAIPEFVAADLLSQAEHGTDSQVLLVCTDPALPEKVRKALAAQLSTLPRKAIAAKALENSKSVYFEDAETALEMINTYAAEHLIISVEALEATAEKIVNAGSVFLGNFTPESVGDYASGTNHTLPTNGFARSFSGVSLDSFVRKVTFQQLTPEGLRLLGPTVEVMAKAEELVAHQQAVRVRIDKLGQN